MVTQTYFTDKVAEYEQYRPKYPSSFFDNFLSWRGQCALDIGAGTGYITLPLYNRGLNVTAVEPNADMRKALKQKIGDRAIPVLDGMADNTGIDYKVDLITLGNVAHWLDGKPERLAACRAEFDRVLKPDGRVAVMALSPSMRNGWISDVFNMARRHDPEFDIEKITRTFSQPEFHASHFIADIEAAAQSQSEMAFGEDDFVGFINSHSFSKPDMDDELRTIFARHQSGGKITVQFDSAIHIGKPRLN